MNVELVREVREEEITEAAFQLGAHKAPLDSAWTAHAKIFKVFTELFEWIFKLDILRPKKHPNENYF